MIGQLQEKKLHYDLKCLYQPNQLYHEIKVDNYICDIKLANQIIEIQTGNFIKIKDKLAYLLNDNQVTVVYPIVYRKYLRMIDDDTLSEPRLSPKKGKVMDAFKELYQIKDLLDHPNLTIEIIMINAEEHRLITNKHRKGYRKVNTYLLDIDQTISFNTKPSYQQFFNLSLDQFSAKELCLSLKVNQKLGWYIIQVLVALDLIERSSKIKNAYQYRLK